MIIKHRLRELAPLGPVCASLGLASLLLAPLAALAFPTEVPDAEAVSAIVVLGIACSALAFLAFFALIAAIGPGRASVITYVNPVIAVALGVALLDERPGPAAIAGLLLILAGSWLSTGGRLPPGPRALRRREAPVWGPGDAAPVSPGRRS
jgi:drug/metabolite transporter (DMT)-like permease